MLLALIALVATLMMVRCVVHMPTFLLVHSLRTCGCDCRSGRLLVHCGRRCGRDSFLSTGRWSWVNSRKRYSDGDSAPATAIQLDRRRARAALWVRSHVGGVACGIVDVELGSLCIDHVDIHVLNSSAVSSS